MRIACVGGGPAGLYFSIVMKQSDQAHDITVMERDAAGQTYGCTAAAIRESSFLWRDQIVHVHGKAPARLGGHGAMLAAYARARSPLSLAGEVGRHAP